MLGRAYQVGTVQSEPVYRPTPFEHDVTNVPKFLGTFVGEVVTGTVWIQVPWGTRDLPLVPDWFVQHVPDSASIPARPHQ